MDVRRESLGLAGRAGDRCGGVALSFLFLHCVLHCKSCVTIGRHLTALHQFPDLQVRMIKCPQRICLAH